MIEPSPQQERDLAYCAYCPKLCRFSCPVSEVTRSETTSTWGKMTQAYLLRSGRGSMDVEVGAALYACTGCMRCRSFCAHENEVGSALFASRETALKSEMAPPGAASTVQTFRQHRNPFGASLGGIVEATRSFTGVEGTPLFVGCTTLVKSPELLDDLRTVADEFACPLALSELSKQCCGYPLYAAGDAGAFQEHARQLAKAMADVPEIAVLDPGCAYMFAVVYPRHSIQLQTRIRTVTSILAGAVPRRGYAPLKGPISYFDACHLGRGLGEYEPPRSLLRRAVDDVREAPEEGREASCSGGGGLLPRTMPEVSREMADRLGSSFQEKSGMIAVACTTSLRQLVRAGHPAKHLISILRAWIAE